MPTARSTSQVVSPVNGRTPASISYSITPIAHTSAPGPTNLAPPRACSGAMYAGVPMTAPVCVRSAPPPRLASPKSATFSTPAASRRTFPGFRSRWTMPSAWAAPTPAAICPIRPAATAGATRPASRPRSARVPPGQNSRAMYGRPSWSP